MSPYNTVIKAKKRRQTSASPKEKRNEKTMCILNYVSFVLFNYDLDVTLAFVE